MGATSANRRKWRTGVVDGKRMSACRALTYSKGACSLDTGFEACSRLDYAAGTQTSVKRTHPSPCVRGSGGPSNVQEPAGRDRSSA